MNTSGSSLFFFAEDQCPSFPQINAFESSKRIVELRDTGCDARKSFTAPLGQSRDEELRRQGNSNLKTASNHQKNCTKQFRNFDKQNLHGESTPAPADSNPGGQRGQQREFLRKGKNEQLKRRKPTIVHDCESTLTSKETLEDTKNVKNSQKSEEEMDENRKDESPYLRKFVDRAVDKDSLSSSHEELFLKNNSERSDKVPIYYMQGHVEPKFAFGVGNIFKYDSTADIKSELNRLSARMNGSYEGENLMKEHVSSANGKPDCTDDSKEVQESAAWRNSLRDHLSGDTRTRISKESLVRGKIKPQRNSMINSTSKLKTAKNSRGSIIETAAQNLRQSEKLSPLAAKKKEVTKLPLSGWKDTRKNIAAEETKIHSRKKWTDTEDKNMESHVSRKTNTNNINEMVTKSDEKQATVSKRDSRISNVPIRIASRKWSKVPSVNLPRQSKILKESETEASRRSRTKPITKRKQNIANEQEVNEDPKVEAATPGSLLSNKVSNELPREITTAASRTSSNKYQATEEAVAQKPIVLASHSNRLKQEDHPQPEVHNSIRELPKLNGVDQKVRNMVEACREQRKRSFVKHGFECDKRRRKNESEELLDIGISVVENVFRL